MTRLPGPVDSRGGHDGGRGHNYRLRRGWRRRDDVRDGTHDSGYQPESTRVVRPVMGTRRRWRRRRWTVVAAMMAMGHVMDGRGAVPAVMMSAGTRTGVGCCRDCESANEGDEKFLVVHITPDFLF